MTLYPIILDDVPRSRGLFLLLVVGVSYFETIVVVILIVLVPFHEMPISVNPGLKFCSGFVLYIPIHCIE